jgi:hypothetical protein
MPSNYEGGHGVNLARFNGLYEFTATLGAAYSPSNPKLQRTALATMAVEARALFDAADAAQRAYDAAVDRRADAYKGLAPLVTRVLKNFRASAAAAAIVADAVALNKKIQGTRATPAPKADPGAEAVTVRSVSQRSFEMQRANFGRLVDLLAGSGAYNPAEEELALPALRARCSAMDAANSACVPLEAAFTAALLRRDTYFYGAATGLVDTALHVKEYIASLDKKKVPAAAGAARFRFRNNRRLLEKAGIAS